VLNGIPHAAGMVEVTVAVTIDREVRELDEKVLVWETRRSSPRNERVGTATQEFVIEVQ